MQTFFIQFVQQSCLSRLLQFITIYNTSDCSLIGKLIELIDICNVIRDNPEYLSSLKQTYHVRYDQNNFKPTGEISEFSFIKIENETDGSYLRVKAKMKTMRMKIIIIIIIPNFGLAQPPLIFLCGSPRILGKVTVRE